MHKQNNVFGTREWAEKTANCVLGCAHNCRYCYAKTMAIRFRRKTSATWPEEKWALHQIKNVCRGRPAKVMFPSTHDITPENIQVCLQALEQMLTYGHHLLIVSKPHLECIQHICQVFSEQKQKILFRFTIGSADNSILKFWEPNAPDFQERLESLRHAHMAGFQTSVSCEPMLDDNVAAVVSATAPFVTDSIWIGKANQLRARLKINGYGDVATMKRADKLIASQSDDRIRALYARFKDSPKIRWKETIKRVLGLELPHEAGLDI